MVAPFKFWWFFKLNLWYDRKNINEGERFAWKYLFGKNHRIAKKRGLNINAWVQDLRQYRFEKIYDLVVSFGTLHFVEKSDWKSLLLKAKENTNIGGIHIIQLFTNVLPASPDIAPFAVGLADDEEIKSLYADWDILQFKTYTFEEEHPGVPKHSHASNKIVAQRIS